MSAEIIYGTDFKRSNPKAALRDIDHIAQTVIVGALADNFIVPGVFQQPDTAPSEMNMDEGA